MYRRLPLLVAPAVLLAGPALLLACGTKGGGIDGGLDGAASVGALGSVSVPPSASPTATAPVVERPAAFAPGAGAPVDLSGASLPFASYPEGTPTVGVKVMEAAVYQKPDRSSPRVGTLRAGAILATNDRKFSGPGCAEGYMYIAGFSAGDKGIGRGDTEGGYVCLADATLDLKDPIVAASSRQPDLASRLPYMYGTCKRGGPLYNRIPTDDDVKAFEPHLDEHLAKWKVDEEFGAPYGQDLWQRWKGAPAPDPLKALTDKLTSDTPAWLANGARVPNLSGTANAAVAKIGDVYAKNGLSFVDTFFERGRRLAVTTDLRIVPADRFRPIKGSDFHGIRIGVDVDASGATLSFPFAFVKGKGAKQWVEKGKKLVQEGEIPWRSALALTGKTRKFDGKFLWETKAGYWIDEKTSVRLDPAKKWPKWANEGEKWLDVNISKQTLIAYEGTKGAYATLVSSGEAGLGDPETSKSTKRGIFRIHTKYVTATMDSNIVGEEFELRDVPYVQYFEGGYALHAAYWHDVFGMPKSHGCINLAPEDARRLFFFTDPPVPPRWHGASKPLTGTVVFIHP